MRACVHVVCVCMYMCGVCACTCVVCVHVHVWCAQYSQAQDVACYAPSLFFQEVGRKRGGVAASEYGTVQRAIVRSDWTDPVT